jgi:hypothetical protein
MILSTHSGAAPSYYRLNPTVGPVTDLAKDASAAPPGPRVSRAFDRLENIKLTAVRHWRIVVHALRRDSCLHETGKGPATG